MRRPKQPVAVCLVFAALLASGMSFADTPPSYTVSFPFLNNQCVYSQGAATQPFFGGSSQNWSSLTVKILLHRLVFDQAPAPAIVAAFLNGEQIGQPVVVANLGLCSNYVEYTFTTTTLNSYQPSTLNNLTVYSPNANIAGLNAQLTFTELKKDLSLEARNLSNLGVLETKALAAQPITAQIPLGATFSLRLTKPGTLPNGVIANWSLDANAPAPGVTADSLFNDVLVEYDTTGPAAETKHFHAAHLGSEKVTMVPTDSQLPTRAVTVIVYAPKTLGDPPHEITDGINRYDLDAQIVKWSHAHGVPPQATKAIMYNETLPRFNAKTWRYEPLSTDFDEFSPNGANQRASALYAGYRMEYDATHGRGSSLVDSQDVHPRSVFYRDKNTRAPLGDAEQMVTAYTLFLNNDFWQNWLKNASPSKRATILQDPQAELNWSAQTTIAASYGLMQVLYEESLAHGWTGIAGSARPYFLFDVPANVPDGGSIQFGTALLADKFKVVNRTQNFHDGGEFDLALTKALSCYNGCYRKYGYLSPYGRTAFDRMRLCMPSADVAIFN